MTEFLASVPAPAWGLLGVIAGAVAGVFGSWLRERREAKRDQSAAKVDAGQLALAYAEGLRTDVDELKAEVKELKSISNAYRSHAHVLHEWGGHVETPERPRPFWPAALPM